MTENLHPDADGHVHLSLGLYVLGGLEDDEAVAVEEHLAHRDECRTENTRVSGVPLALALLNEDEVQSLIREFGVPDRPAESLPGRPATATRAGSGRGGPSTASAPANGRPPGRPGSARRRWRPAQIRVAVAGCLIVLAMSVGAGLWLTPQTGPTPIDTVLTGETTDSTSGATLTVVVTRQPARAAVRATVSRLRPAIPYQLFAVTTDGRTLSVGHWLGTSAPKTVAGDINATVPEIAVFTVAQQDGAVVVSVRFGSGP